MPRTRTRRALRRRRTCRAFALALVLVTAASCTTPGAWTVLDPPPQGGRPPELPLRLVDCSSPTSCVAVGRTDDAQYASMAWDGSSWRAVTAPNIEPQSLACLPTHCLLFASYGYASWDGTAWTSHPLPTIGSTYHVSCTDTTCFSIGYDDAIGPTKLLRWTGAAWVATPGTRARTGPLYGVSCTDDDTCVLLGADAATGGTGVERWHDGTWTTEVVPGPPVTLVALSCPSSSRCAATGSFAGTGGNAGRPAVATAVDGTWTVGVAPGPAGPGVITDLDCSSPSTCVARGTDHRGARYDGTSWTNAPVPTFAREREETDLVCAGDTRCFLVVDAPSAPGAPAPANIAQWDGTAWGTSPQAPAPSIPETAFTDVSCVTAQDCVAVGTYLDGAATRFLAERWNGSRWTVLADPPMPNGATTGTTLAASVSVDCPAASSCLFATTVRQGGTDVAVVARWGGGSWQTESLAPFPAGTRVLVADVACGGPQACLIVGVSTAGSVSTPFAQAWNGTQWSFTAPPASAPGLAGPQTALSCPAPNACALLASQLFPDLRMVNTVQRWNGTSWSTTPSPLPILVGTSQNGVLTDIDCAAVDHCVAVGFTLQAPVATIWNGSTWSSQTLPSTTQATLLVSCGRPDSCLATATPSGASPLVGFAWRGSSWATTDTLTLPNAVRLTAISCAGNGCLAVGSQTTGQGRTPFAVRR